MATILFDDNALASASNEAPTLAQVYRSIIAALNAFAARPRPILNRVGGNDNSYETNAEPQIRALWYPMSMGAPALIGHALAVPIANAAAVPLTGLTLTHSDASQVFTQLITQPKGHKEDINEDPNIWYPLYAQPATIFANHTCDYPVSPTTARPLVIQSGLSGSYYGPQIRSAMVMERLIETKNQGAVAHPVIGKEAAPTDYIAPNSDVVGTGLNFRSLSALRDYANRLFVEKSMQFSWNMNHNGTGTQGRSIGSTVTCILDPNYGASGLTAPTPLGPGFKVPLRYTGKGRAQTVNVYPRIYARMPSGGTGRMYFYNRDFVGGMTGPFQPTNNAVVSGSSWQWWPSGNFDPINDPYFTGNASPSYFTDNIVPCAAGSGGSIEVSAITLRVCPS